MIIIRNIKLPLGKSEKSLKALAAKALRIDEKLITRLTITKKSIDARKKPEVYYLYSVAVSVKGDEKRILNKNAKNSNIAEYRPFSYEIPSVMSKTRPVIVGFGPAGMFAGLVLSKAGLQPIIIERGSDVTARTKAVKLFWETGKLDTSSNVQFGEGGAGTFSDGKLNTGTHDKRISWVLSQLHKFGASVNITYDAKPHIGTDVLSTVVKNIREHIISLGGEVHFNTKLTKIKKQDNILTAITVQDNEKEYDILCSDLILAIGHSARDTFEMLYSDGIKMEPKAFSMGVRIEHYQNDIGNAQYGSAYTSLPSADYKLNCRLPDGSSAYTFCMCPGGYVVAAASEEGTVVTNGMSYSDRGGENANSAVLVTLSPEDFPDTHTLSGMYWQREIEKRAYEYGGGNYKAPAQKVGDFLNGTPSASQGTVAPTYRPGVIWGDIREVLPKKITDTLMGAIPALGEKLKGFDSPDAVMTAPETRSSSPVRILRDETLNSLSLTGLYPCGEGAGYAGGITSAAVDGMRCAEAVIKKYSEK